MSYKLLVLDIDGTVTNSKKEITPKTKEAILELQKKGIPVAIASGRPTKGIVAVADELDFAEYGSYVLAFNGARIINWKTKECIYSKELPIGIPKKLYDDAMHYGTGLMTYEGDSIISAKIPDEYIMIESRITTLPVIKKPDFKSYVNFPVNKCILTADGELLESIEPVIAEKYQLEAQVFRSEPYFLEVLPKNVDKAYCLERLLKILGIEREEMVCCGDGFNDISMIQYAGLGVAMANAQEKVKDVADYITINSNDEDGIASIRITNEVAKEWQTDTRELYTLALKNSERIFEEKIMPMSEVIGMFDVQLQEMGLKKPALKRECLYEPYVVTNNMGINGASVILYQDIFKRLAEKIGGDFYILPSSIHEVLAMSAKAGLTKEELKNMVKEVNDNCLLPDEYLSDSVYRYNKTFNSLEIVA